MEKYEWTKGSRVRVAADIAAVEMERIRKERGVMTAHVLVEESKPKRAPLHNAFEWNDEIAGNEYRLMQARTLIRSIIVINEEGQEDHRIYTLVRSDNTDLKTEYMPSRMVVRNKDLFADAIERLVAEISSAKDSVRDLEGLAKQMGVEVTRMKPIKKTGDALEKASKSASLIR